MHDVTMREKIKTAREETLEDQRSGGKDVNERKGEAMRKGAREAKVSLENTESRSGDFKLVGHTSFSGGDQSESAEGGRMEIF